MPLDAAKRNARRCPTHPGALLREDVLPALGLSKVGIAEALGISRQHPYDILGARKPVARGRGASRHSLRRGAGGLAAHAGRFRRLARRTLTNLPGRPKCQGAR